MTSKHPWELSYNNRLAWAERAREGFARTMPKDLRDQIRALGSRADVPVAVYGHSQVGKTTLILKLLGITTEAEGQVGRILRGRTRPGQPSTATLMVYRHSKDEHYYLFRPGCNQGDQMDGLKLEGALAEVRRRIETGSVPIEWLDRAFIIEIPRSCFTPDLGPAIQILDLPGDQSSNLKERAHVDALIQRYTSLATTILLVTKGNSLRALDNPPWDALRGWERQVSRCRLVVTYALSAHSVKAKLARKDFGGEQSIAELQAHYLEEFTKDLPSKEVVPRVYAMEYGDSWAVAAGDPQFVNRFGPAMDAQFGRLREDLRKMASPHNRILSIVGGKAIIDWNLQQTQEDHRRRHQDLAATYAILREMRYQLKHWTERCEAAKGQLVPEELPLITLPRPELHLPTMVPGFKTQLRGLFNIMKGHADEVFKAYKGEFGYAECEEVANRLHETLWRGEGLPFMRRLDSHWQRRYWPSISPDLAEDTRELRRIYRLIPEQLETQMAVWIQAQRRENNHPVRAELGGAEAQLGACRAAHFGLEQEWYQQRKALLLSARDRSEWRREMRNSSARFAAFDTHLKQEALEEHDRIVRDMNSQHMGPALRFFRLMQLQLLAQDCELFRGIR